VALIGLSQAAADSLQRPALGFCDGATSAPGPGCVKNVHERRMRRIVFFSFLLYDVTPERSFLFNVIEQNFLAQVRHRSFHTAWCH